MARLILSLDGHVMAEYNMSKERYTLGRLPDNDVRVDNPAFTVGLSWPLPRVFEPGDGVFAWIGVQQSSAGSVRGTLTIVSNDPEEGTLEIPLAAEFQAGATSCRNCGGSRPCCGT